LPNYDSFRGSSTDQRFCTIQNYFGQFFLKFLTYIIAVNVEDDMNLTEEKKAPLREKRLDEKRELLAMQFKGSIQVCALVV